MIKAAAKLFRVSFLMLLVVLGVTFAVSNRQQVELTFFPLPWSLSVPMFIVVILLFSLGALTAWMIVRLATHKERSLNRKTLKRMQALENEIAALRSEQLARQTTPVKQPFALVK